MLELLPGELLGRTVRERQIRRQVGNLKALLRDPGAELLDIHMVQASVILTTVVRIAPDETSTIDQ